MGWDAVVVGAGHNGLVAANLLADSGWSVLVLEANATPGGATRTAELAASGFRSDLCSAFYPLTAASPTIAALELGRYGLRWRNDHVPLVHVLPDGRTVTLSRDPAETAASVEKYGAGDGERWLAEFAAWGRMKDAVIDALLTPFPPVRPGVRLARRLGSAELLRFARFAVQSTRRYTPTSRSTRPAARSSAGCCRCWPRTSASRWPRAAPSRSPTRWCAGWRSAAASCAAGPG
jgi:phytoene dehydrogenase-like protein